MRRNLIQLNQSKIIFYSILFREKAKSGIIPQIDPRDQTELSEGGELLEFE